MAKRKKGIVALVVLLLVTLTMVSTVMANGRAAVPATVVGVTSMSIPLTEFGLDLEGNADMDELSYAIRRRGDGSLSGHYFYQVSFLGTTNSYSGEVVCLKVEGDRAWVGATVDESTNPDRLGTYSWWQVKDNQDNSSASRSTFVGFGTLEETIDYCEGPDPNFIFDVQRGNIRVNSLDH
ncbi:hypothetical protein [Candidatus Leptofilum sp.]|uniref:hypothetical protein n=1 Tax=Candidatus Leptofilum sp. TaxID=3241576 RepID=UPI003B5B885F